MPTGLFPMPDSEIRAGNVVRWAQLEYKAGSTLTVGTDDGDGDPAYSHTASLATAYTPDSIDIDLGITIDAGSSFDGTSGSWATVYNGPGAPFGGYIRSGSGFRSDVSMSAVLKNVRLYCMETGAALRIMWDAIDIYVNGALDITLPGSGVDATGAGTGPNYIPVVGIPPSMSGGCSASRANTHTWPGYNPCSPDLELDYDYETSVDSTVYGGWRYREVEDGDWLDLPVTPYSGAVPDPGSCPFGLGSPSAVTAGRTWGDLLSSKSRTKYQFHYNGKIFLTQLNRLICEFVEVTRYTSAALGIDPCTGAPGSPQYKDDYQTNTESESQGGQILLIPDLSPSLDRFATGFAKVLYRNDFPETKASLAHTCVDDEDGVTSHTFASSNPTVHTALSEFLGLVRDADHAVLDGFDRTAYAPCSASHSQSANESHDYPTATFIVCPPDSDHGDCPPGTDGAWSCTILPFADLGYTKSESVSFSFPSSVGTVSNYQGHYEPLARYLATWPNPHWHLFDWRQDWYLQGGNAPWAPPSEDDPGYWGPVRDQWLYNAALPDGEKPKTRSMMIASPYYDWAHTPFFDAFTAGLPWTGVSRWITRECDFPTSITLDNSCGPMLTCPDGSCTVSAIGGNLQVVSTGGDCVVDIDLATFECYPYLALLLAKSVKFASRSNVDSVKARLISAFGGGKDLNGGAALSTGVDYAFPRAKDSGYAGSWGGDSGVGYLSDVGTDVAAGGQSPATMADAERSTGFEGLQGMQGATLRLTIVPTDPGDDCLLALPLFKRDGTHPTVKWLDGNKAALIWPDGPGVLWGTGLSYVPDEGLYSPWLPKGLGTPNSLADALCWIRAVLEARDPGDVTSLNAEVNGYYDDFEVSLRNIGSADKFSFSFILPKGAGETIRFALVQTVAEVPPLACFPTRARTEATWLANGAPALERWDQAQETKYIIQPGTPLILKSPGGAVLSSSDSAPSGWSIQKYVLSLDGDEADDFILASGVTIATVYPWRGWFRIGDPQGFQSGWPAQARRGQLHLAIVETGDVRYQRAKFTTPEAGLHEDGVVTSFGDVALARMVVDESRNKVILAVSRGATAPYDLYMLVSTSDGRDFDAGTLIATNTMFGTPYTEPSGVTGMTWFEYDSGSSGPGTQKAQVAPPGPGAILGSTFTFKDSTGTDIPVADGGASHVVYAHDGQRRAVWTPTIDGESVPSVWYSTDRLETWTRV